MLVKEFIKYLKKLPQEAEIDYCLHSYYRGDSEHDFNLGALFKTGKTGKEIITIWIDE